MSREKGLWAASAHDYLTELVHKWTYLGRKDNKFSLSLWVHAAHGFKLEEHDRQYMRPCFHAAQYRALKRRVFCQHLPLGFSGTFDMF